MNNVEINISNVSKKFKDISALDNVSMRFETGKLYGIIGPAGAGKTTLFRLMLRLMRAGAGNIEYVADGRVMRFADFAENIAYMPQSQSLYADLSVNEHLEFFKKLYGIGDAEYAKKKQELVHLARLDKFLDRPAGHLSGGMYKKLGLMCALLRSPKVMLLDEPTNGVDPISRFAACIPCPGDFGNYDNGLYGRGGALQRSCSDGVGARTGGGRAQGFVKSL